MIIKPPPDFIDGAKVIQWAWSGAGPFGFVCSENHTIHIAIFGLAICQYTDSGTIYRFCCDHNWSVIQDFDYTSIDDAVQQLPQQYRNVEPLWYVKE